MKKFFLSVVLTMSMYSCGSKNKSDHQQDEQKQEEKSTTSDQPQVQPQPQPQPNPNPNPNPIVVDNKCLDKKSIFEKEISDQLKNWQEYSATLSDEVKNNKEQLIKEFDQWATMNVEEGKQARMKASYRSYIRCK